MVPLPSAREPGASSRRRGQRHVGDAELLPRCQALRHGNQQCLPVRARDLQLLAGQDALRHLHVEQLRLRLRLLLRRLGRRSPSQQAGYAAVLLQHKDADDPLLVVHHPEQHADYLVRLGVAPCLGYLEHHPEVVLAQAAEVQPPVDRRLEARAELLVELRVHQGVLLRVVVDVVLVVREEVP
eukprot:CAMPEP_0197901576 /NCGR_PEP_ID=MMETSP1439-20131203/51369_1 /TAXON_ID=66791 /ORGANISM="Gonyaulax spinifera, Strain CCMP409" /LENGTH=182 /DNA_ID=CAMNT_0043522553 /DNA_START=27 /DNA_END=575 /DNA_ORIENTATION=+